MLDELLATLPGGDGLLEPGLAALQPADELLELGEGVLEARSGGGGCSGRRGAGCLVGHLVSSTRVVRPPRASCTSTRSPGATAVASRSTGPPGVPPLRTIA